MGNGLTVQVERQGFAVDFHAGSAAEVDGLVDHQFVVGLRRTNRRSEGGVAAFEGVAAVKQLHRRGIKPPHRTAGVAVVGAQVGGGHAAGIREVHRVTRRVCGVLHRAALNVQRKKVVDAVRHVLQENRAGSRACIGAGDLGAVADRDFTSAVVEDRIAGRRGHLGAAADGDCADAVDRNARRAGRRYCAAADGDCAAAVDRAARRAGRRHRAAADVDCASAAGYCIARCAGRRYRAAVDGDCAVSRVICKGAVVDGFAILAGGFQRAARYRDRAGGDIPDGIVYSFQRAVLAAAAIRYGERRTVVQLDYGAAAVCAAVCNGVAVQIKRQGFAVDYTDACAEVDIGNDFQRVAGRCSCDRTGESGVQRGIASTCNLHHVCRRFGINLAHRTAGFGVVGAQGVVGHACAVGVKVHRIAIG